MSVFIYRLIKNIFILVVFRLIQNKFYYIQHKPIAAEVTTDSSKFLLLNLLS